MVSPLESHVGSCCVFLPKHDGGHPGHMDKCLTAWYAYMRPQLLEQVNPENTSKDVWESLLEANHHYQIPGIR